MNNKTEIIRELIHTDEFDKYFDSLDERVKDKFSEYLEILETVYGLLIY